MKVGFLGLGVMGHGMAAQILSRGHHLTIYNRTRDRANDLASRGAQVATTPREAAVGNEVVVTMVANDQALRDVAEGTDGVLAGLPEGATLLQMSTVGPETTAWLASEVAKRGGAFVDAPVMGSLPEAAEGTLWVLAGAEPDVLERARPVLECVSQTVYHIGPIGQGTRIKLAVNLVGGGLVAALSEGIALTEAAGIDPSLYIQIVKDTNLPTRLWIGKATQMATNDFAPRFSLENMAKDLTLAVDLGRSYGLQLAQGMASRATLLRGAEAVGGDKDMAAAIEGVRRG